MKFSEHFGLDYSAQTEWFDLILNLDTKLFIDPFLIYASEDGHFEGSHDYIVSYFNDVFTLIASSKGEKNSVSWKKSQGLLLFPEAEEFKLGYAKMGKPGAGSGAGFAKIIGDSLWEAITAGKEELQHFEEIGILREGIGADRISDITATILKERFVSYTEQICTELKIKTKPFTYNRGSYNPEYLRRGLLKCSLPVNPDNGMPILLTPKKYIRDLPTISADDFWNYCYDNENEMLRNDFGQDITRNVDKKTIIKLATKRPDLRAEYIACIEETDPEPYNLHADKRGYFRWYEDSKHYCASNPLDLHFLDREEFQKCIESIVSQFQNYVENNGGWNLLWNDDKSPKSEEASQFLMQGIVMHWCKASNIDISREVNIGRGPVDFKVSQGHAHRALLELKLAKNSKFWNGLSKQLPKYQEAEGIDIGYFIIVLQTDKDIKRLNKIQERVESVREATGYDIKHVICRSLDLI